MLAALVLLATLLVGLMTAKSGAERQWLLAERRMQAVAATERLLASWLTPSDSGDIPGVPIDDTDALPGLADLRWETVVLDQESASALRCRVVRLSIVDPKHEGQPSLLTVDLLSPLPEEGSATSDEADGPNDEADDDAPSAEGDG